MTAHRCGQDGNPGLTTLGWLTGPCSTCATSSTNPPLGYASWVDGAVTGCPDGPLRGLLQGGLERRYRGRVRDPLPAPASGALFFASHDSEPDHSPGARAARALSRRYSFLAVVGRVAAGPVRTPNAPIQANESAVTPAPGLPASKSVTMAHSAVARRPIVSTRQIYPLMTRNTLHQPSGRARVAHDRRIGRISTSGRVCAGVWLGSGAASPHVRLTWPLLVERGPQPCSPSERHRE